MQFHVASGSTASNASKSPSSPSDSRGKFTVLSSSVTVSRSKFTVSFISSICALNAVFVAFYQNASPS